MLELYNITIPRDSRAVTQNISVVVASFISVHRTPGEVSRRPIKTLFNVPLMEADC